MAKITIEELSGSLKEYLNEIGNAAEDYITTIKELLVNSIGNPLDVNDDFSKITDDIYNLVSDFKIGLMRGGVTVESNDRFQELIIKLNDMIDGDINVDNALYESLASILTEEGVEVTEEDDMASLIGKTDVEFTNKINEINDKINEINTMKQSLVTALNNRKISCSNTNTFDELIGLIQNNVFNGRTIAISGTDVTHVSASANTNSTGSTTSTILRTEVTMKALSFPIHSLTLVAETSEGSYTKTGYVRTLTIEQHRNGVLLKKLYSAAVDDGSTTIKGADIQVGDVIKFIADIKEYTSSPGIKGYIKYRKLDLN